MKSFHNILIPATMVLSPILVLADPVVESGSPDKAKTEKAEAKTPDQKIVVEANDLMQFNKKELEIKAGDMIELTLKHTGKQPKEIMGHNLVILTQGTNLTTWATQAMTARATDFIPTAPEAKKAIIAHTELLGGGEEDTITFSIEETGEYEFLCSFPGHFGVMRGKVLVK